MEGKKVGAALCIGGSLSAGTKIAIYDLQSIESLHTTWLEYGGADNTEVPSEFNKSKGR